MKKITFILVLIIAFSKLQAQNYQVSFAGSGETAIVETVEIQNLTQGTVLTINGTDVLHLLGSVDIAQLKSKDEKTLHIYPNPTTSKCNIEFKATAPGLTTIELFDITGRKIASTQNNLRAGTQIFNVTGLSSETYTVNIKSGSFSYSGKIISNSQAAQNAKITFVDTKLNAERSGNFKSSNDLVQMQYNTGDRLLFKSISGIYSVITVLVPSASTTITSNFVACTDSDNNNYPTVTIGSQTWMAENLKTTKYNDGTDIPIVIDNSTWAVTASPAYCWYNNQELTYKNIYGGLYNWYAVDIISNGNKNVCPSGWHAPTDPEWTILAPFTGTTGVAGSILKETGITHWSVLSEATNESGFTALPGGFRYAMDGVYESLGASGDFWSSTFRNTGYAFNRTLSSDYTYFDRYYYSKKNGFSVRCIMD